MKYLIATLLLSSSVSANTLQCPSVYPCDKDHNVQEQFIESPCYDQFALSCMSAKVKEVQVHLRFLDSKVIKLKKKLRKLKGKK